MGWGGGDASAFGIIAKSFRATDAFLPDREQRRGAFSVRGPPLCDVSARPETMALGDCLSTMTNALDVEDGGVVDFPNGTHEKKISAVELGDFPHRGDRIFRPFLFVDYSYLIMIVIVMNMMILTIMMIMIFIIMIIMIIRVMMMTMMTND